MKEKIKGLWGIITGIGCLAVAGLIVAALFGAFDDEVEKIGELPIIKGNDTKSPLQDDEQYVFDDGTESQKNEEKEKEDAVEQDVIHQDNSDIDAMLPGDPDYDKYLHVGRTYTTTDQVDMEILDAGFGYGVVYVLVEMTNNGDHDVYFDQSDATLYIDDYEVPDGLPSQMAIDNGYVFVTGDTAYPTAASANAGGRKGSLVFVADIPDTIVETSEVEFEILGGVFKINPLVTDQARKNTEENIYGLSSSESETSENYVGIVYGTYVQSLNSVGGYNNAYVGFASDNGDTIMIDCYEADTEGMPDNIGDILTQDGDSYKGEKFSITFVDGGMNVEVISSDGDYEKYAGYYTLDEVLDLNDVG